MCLELKVQYNFLTFCSLLARCWPFILSNDLGSLPTYLHICYMTDVKQGYGSNVPSGQQHTALVQSSLVFCHSRTAAISYFWSSGEFLRVEGRGSQHQLAMHQSHLRNFIIFHSQAIPYPDQINQEFWRQDLGISIFKNLPILFQYAAKIENHWLKGTQIRKGRQIFVGCCELLSCKEGSQRGQLLRRLVN